MTCSKAADPERHPWPLAFVGKMTRNIGAPRGIVRYRLPLGTELSPLRRNGKGKLMRLGSRFRHRNDSSVKIICRACRHKVDS